MLRGDLTYSALCLGLGAMAVFLPRLLSGVTSGRVLAAWSGGVAVVMVTPLTLWALKRLQRNVEI